MYVGGNQVIQAGGANVNKTGVFSQASASEPFLGVRRYATFNTTDVGATSAAGSNPAGTAPSAGDLQQLQSIAQSAGISVNAVLAYIFFVGKGLAPAQAAGIVGNLQQESGINPETSVLDSNGKMSYGLASWNAGSYPDAAGQVTGNYWADFQNQLGYLWGQIGPGGAAATVTSAMSTTDPQAAAVTFQNGFERCSNCNPTARSNYAEQVFMGMSNVQPATLTSWIGKIGGDIGGWIGQWVFGPAGGAAGGAAGKAVGNIGADFSSLNKILGWLTDLTKGSFWLRAGEFALGVVLTVGGVALFMSTTKAGQQVEGDVVKAAGAALMA
jgi:hypothetical protein